MIEPCFLACCCIYIFEIVQGKWKSTGNCHHIFEHKAWRAHPFSHKPSETCLVATKLLSKRIRNKHVFFFLIFKVAQLITLIETKKKRTPLNIQKILINFARVFCEQNVYIKRVQCNPLWSLILYFFFFFFAQQSSLSSSFPLVLLFLLSRKSH